ncbi:hypothetical protein SDC9_197843 [bioreactor metagenome]|uniref:Uncharacterized protein n=1 Tax=bioreactor metagenome TaxID=1076179 RepID=A0A645IFZ8_9ZZZZ
MVECELQIYSDASLSTLITTAKFNFTCRPAMLSADALVSTQELPMLRTLMDQVETLRQEALLVTTQAQEAAAACENLITDKVTTFSVRRYAEVAQEPEEGGES